MSDSLINLRIPAGSSLASQLNHDLIEHLPVGVYLCDQTGAVVAYNRKAAEIWGENPVIGQTQKKYCGAHKLLTLEGVHVPHDETPLAQVLITQKGISNFRAIVERRDGSQVPVLANVVPLFDEAGEMVGFMNSVQDLSVHQSFESERMRLQDALYQSQKMEVVGQLTSGLAHDFNNQLASVSMALQLMEREIDEAASERLKTRFKTAQQAVIRATALADNLLNFSRHRPRQVALVSPNDTLLSIEQLLRSALGTSMLLKLDLSAEARSVQCNAQELVSTLLNLTLNARDAMPSGGQLSISTSSYQPGDLETPAQSTHKGEFVRISVQDNGRGMDEETLDKVFTPFFTTKASGMGTGLGLSMVKGFVSDLNGFLSVESRLGEGTTIHLSLPAT